MAAAKSAKTGTIAQMKLEISIIVPTLNEEDNLRSTLDALQNFGDAEIIVVDGGSDDATVSIARDYNVKILHSKRGRGTQMQTGGARRRFMGRPRRHRSRAGLSAANKKYFAKRKCGRRKFYDSL